MEFISQKVESTDGNLPGPKPGGGVQEESAGNSKQYLQVLKNPAEYLLPDAASRGMHKLREELRDMVVSRNHLDNILRSIVDMLFIFDRQFHIQQISQKACELLQQPESKLLGQPVNVLFDGRKNRFLERVKATLMEKGEIHKVQTSLKMPGKLKLPVTISLFTLRNQKEETTGYLMVAEDVEEKVQTSRALKQRNDELKTLIYKTSHDLKGPIASMLGLFQTLEKEKQDQHTLQFYLFHLKRSAEKLNKTLMGLLEIGLVDQGEDASGLFNLYLTINKVVGIYDEYRNEEVEINVRADRELYLNSYEKSFVSILQSLLENSIKYRRRSSYDPCIIDIKVRCKSKGIDLIVKDNGQGMDKQVLKRAFDMFYRGNELSDGSGLGLFIVKSNVEIMGGSIKLRSRVNAGTEVRIFLPSLD